MNIESMLDKKSGKTYGSAMNKTLIAFIDDLNMPYVDKYGEPPLYSTFGDSEEALLKMLGVSRIW